MTDPIPTSAEVEEADRCDGRITRQDGTWIPCEMPKGHGIINGVGCSARWTEDRQWNPRDTERRKGERRAALPLPEVTP